MAVPGTDLLWRSTLSWEAPGDDPVVTQLEIDWLVEAASLDSIVDIPRDQGKQVRIVWSRSAHDFPGDPNFITGYTIYRKIDAGLASSAAQRDVTVSGSLTGDTGRPLLAYPPGEWDYIITVPARQEDTYSAVVPTLADSAITGGMYHTTFFISALTDTQWVYFDSSPDSGYSVDNLSPQVPLGLTVAYNTENGNELSWGECPDPDFQYFRIYRGDSDTFVPSELNYIQGTVDPSWQDTVEGGWKYFYKVTAVDFSGNESDAASASSTTGDDTPQAPDAFALYQNVPNPFNPATMIRFDLPKTAHVKLSVFNVKGELVSTIADRQMSEGCKEFIWTAVDNRGRAVSSGIYFYRLVAGEFVQTRKMVLLR